MSVDDKAVLFPGGQFFHYPLTMNLPVLHYRVNIQAPPNSPFAAMAEGLEGATGSEERTTEFRKVTFEGNDIPTPRPRIMLPPDEPQYPAVVLSSGPTWRNLAAWYGRIVDERAGPLSEGERTLTPADAGSR